MARTRRCGHGPTCVLADTIRPSFRVPWTGKLALAFSCVTANFATSSVCESIFASLAPPSMVLAADNTKYAVHTTRNDDSSRERCITKERGTIEESCVTERQ